MPLKQIASPDAKYLAATDILIGDMSDTNYEFLLYNRPIILLANEWLRDNFADIGIKTDVRGLESAIARSIENPAEYSDARNDWLKRTIYLHEENASPRVLDIAIERSGYLNPSIIIVHGESEVRKSNLLPLYEEACRRNMNVEFLPWVHGKKYRDECIFFAVHFEDLKIQMGYKVHLDHGLKGQGTANVEIAKIDYTENNFFPLINLHITAGQVGDERTKMLLGPNSDRSVIGGYPKADYLKRDNTPEDRRAVFRELGFDENIPLITYAPAGELSHAKPGGSLSPEVIESLQRLSKSHDYNILIKLKQAQRPLYIRVLTKLRRLIP